VANLYRRRSAYRSFDSANHGAFVICSDQFGVSIVSGLCVSVSTTGAIRLNGGRNIASVGLVWQRGLHVHVRVILAGIRVTGAKA